MINSAKQSIVPQAVRWIASSLALLAMTAEKSRRAVADRRLERQRGIPRKKDPGVLRHLGDEGIDQRPAFGLGVDGGEMRVRHHLAHQPPGLAGVDEII